MLTPSESLTLCSLSMGWVTCRHRITCAGYTTLCALTFTAKFAAGASYYGVADLGALAADTHKFEARYLDGLVGPWPQAQALYAARSPLAHIDRMVRTGTPPHHTRAGPPAG